GVQPMLDAIVDYLPSPVDIPAVQGHAVGDEDTVVERNPDPEAPFSALAFKIMADQHLGKLTYIRVYSGTVESGSTVLNSIKDPTFQVRTDEETGQTIIAGMGELHLEVLVDRMRREFRVEANIGRPQVAYRETVTRKVEKVEYTHKKQTGGSGQYGRVLINLEP